jgi:Zn-finger nucleic acid-binding protein
MNCPHCNVTLIMADKLGIEIDYCPQCRGVWLDRGELDKIIERSASYENVREERGSLYNDSHKSHHKEDQHHRGKRRSLLSELFD